MASFKSIKKQIKKDISDFARGTGGQVISALFPIESQLFGPIIESNVGGRTGQRKLPPSREDPEEEERERRRLEGSRIVAANTRGRGAVLGGSRDLLAETRQAGLAQQPILSRKTLG